MKTTTNIRRILALASTAPVTVEYLTAPLGAETALEMSVYPHPSIDARTDALSIVCAESVDPATGKHVATSE
jgi:hypothetical protein